ncbi:unnamed protein product [Mytilus edulis]|uniref:Uncharacterized protein n=1 Tax=Mytilus edulis TaxID=6550 RepID=A0A8S3V504_MYTED|nr:unnamed protein product [Mytilus edulis]
MFIHLEKSKAEIKSVFTEASSILNTSSISEARLVKSAKLGQDENVDGLIELASIKSIPVEMNAYVKQFFHRKAVTIDLYGFDVYSGVFVSDEVVIVGGKVKESAGILKAINITNERIVDKFSISTIVKRLTFDFESESLFVSCYGSKLYRFKFANSFLNSKVNVEVGDHYNGGIFICDGVLYVIVDKTVKKISLVNTQQSLEMCFKTNTNCTSLNGLGIDSKNNRFLYTSEKQEVVCTSLDGSEIFKYKDEFMKQTSSVYVHSEGLVFVGDEKGSMHLISEDGCRRRTVLNSCDKLKTVSDICLDKSCSRLAVFGPGYIELYDVCTGSG